MFECVGLAGFACCTGLKPSGRGAGQAAGNQTGIYVTTWADNGSAAPSSPSQSQLASEAVRALRQHVRELERVEAVRGRDGDRQQRLGLRDAVLRVAQRDLVLVRDIAYTNLPYITDAGASCGANFNNLGPNAGITIVEGHEMAETVTGQFPNGGWLDRQGAENGDKCAWISSGQGASASVSMGGASFPVQSLWSNAFNSDKGGCVLSYP